MLYNPKLRQLSKLRWLAWMRRHKTVRQLLNPMDLQWMPKVHYLINQHRSPMDQTPQWGQKYPW
jgi:hypothetical protein